ncbi:archease [Caldithrix abyssi]
MMSFRQIEHTADLGLEVFGKTISELFINAHAGFYSLCFGELELVSQLLPSSARRDSLRLSEPSLEDLLVAFLSELNFNVQVRKTVFFPLKSLTVEQQNGAYTLQMEAPRQMLPLELQEQLTEIKAVTYHGLQIIQKNGQYAATIIFDI